MSVIVVVIGLAVLAMSIAWAVVRRAGDGAWTDVFWTFSVGSIGALAALWPAAEAAHSRQLLVAGVAVLWALRLGAHLTARTIRADRPDPRYERFKEKWGGWGFQAWAFLMVQAGTIVVLVLALRAAAVRPPDALDLRDALAVLIVVVALCGEALADRQMAAFRNKPANKGKVADTGLWAWSRHPNYFFEWVFWLALPVMALSIAEPFSWLTLLAPIQMWWLLNHVSGVPLLEHEMLQSRPKAYRAYQQRVSRFVPLPPKHSDAAP